MSPTQTQADHRFIERMGQQAQSDGIPRIAGQIWAALVLAPAPLSSLELMKLLQISKGSVSTNSRLLEMLGIVERRSRPGERQDYFSIGDNPYSALVEGQVKRFVNAQVIVTEAMDGIDHEQTRQKLSDLGRFYALYHEASASLLDTLRATPSAVPKPGQS